MSDETKRKIGRNNPTISLTLTPRVYGWVRSKANELGYSVSRFVDSLLGVALEREEKRSGKQNINAAPNEQEGEAETATYEFNSVSDLGKFYNVNEIVRGITSADEIRGDARMSPSCRDELIELWRAQQ